jgi:Ni,Fe-hydrogenase III small subunit
MVYPKALSVLMAADADRPEDHGAMVDAVRHGDILLFNGWYHNEGAEKIKKLYEEAGVVLTRSP